MIAFRRPPPDYYKLGRFERCGNIGCTGEWTDGQGNFWCCGRYQQTKKQEYAPMEPHADGCKPVDPAVAEQEMVLLLRKMVVNQQQIIDILKDISIGLA